MIRNHHKNNNQTIISPNRRKKYYLKNKWVFSILAIGIFLVSFLLGIYFYRDVPLNDYVNARIVRVIDGDTIDVFMKGKTVRVRMIGIDAPESVSYEEERNSVYGEYASEYTKRNLKEGEQIYLTFDLEQYDQYDRLLAYVWMKDDFEDINNLYQYQMVKDGYAVIIKIEPNTQYYYTLREAMCDAVEAEHGLWADKTFYNENKMYQ